MVRAAAALILMILPNLIWILLDRGMWVSDTALYGLSAVQLHHLWLDDPARWLEGALSVAPKPPVLAWVGHLFVPIGKWMGNIDSGLLLVNWLAQGLALAFLFLALVEYSRDQRCALAGCAAMASAPLFVEVSLQLYVQPVQMAAVCWFIYIMARSARWDRWTIVLQLISATSLAMLSTVSSLAFCVVPGAVSLAQATRKPPTRTRLEGRHGFHFVLAASLGISTIAWYWRNLREALDYGSFSVNYVWAGVPGAAYAGRLWTWILLLLYGFGVALLVSCALLFGAVLLRSRRRAASNGEPAALPLVAGVAQIGIALGILASTSLQVQRYPLPLLAYLALIVGVSLRSIDRRWLSRSVLAIFIAQLVLTNLSSYGYLEHGFWPSRPLRASPGRELELVEAISQIAEGESESKVALATSVLGIYSFQVSYHAAKKDYALAAAGPQYESVEFLLTRSDVSADVDAAWEEIDAAKPSYIVLASHALRRAQREEWMDSPRGWGTIMRGTVDISERLIEGESYEPVELSRYPELAVYRRTEAQ
jgi:hypothetical protein